MENIMKPPLILEWIAYFFFLLFFPPYFSLNPMLLWTLAVVFLIIITTSKYTTARLSNQPLRVLFKRCSTFFSLFLFVLYHPHHFWSPRAQLFLTSTEVLLFLDLLFHVSLSLCSFVPSSSGFHATLSFSRVFFCFIFIFFIFIFIFFFCILYF